MNDNNSAFEETISAGAAHHSSGLLTDADVSLLEELNTEFAPQIPRNVSQEEQEQARERVCQEVEARLKAEGHEWADVFAHAVVHDQILADAKYRVMLDWFNRWVKRIEAEGEFSRFTDIKRIGAGGFGVVFRAQDSKRLDDNGPSPVAIKLPHFPTRLSDRNTVRQPAKQIANFFIEARRHAGITVAGCVTLLDSGIPDAAATEGDINVDLILDWLRTSPIWFSMQLIQGQSLKEVVNTATNQQSETLTIDRCIRLMTDVAVILKRLHATELRGGKGYIIHKDLKPSNILLDDQPEPNPWLTDFGLATPRASQTVFGNPISGTPAYMAPEQWSDDTEANYVDAQTDIWAWGIIFYEVLTGLLPFVGKGDELRNQIQWSNPDSLRLRNGKIPQYIEDIIFKCLKRDRRDRFRSLAEILDALQSGVISPRVAEELQSGLDRVESKVDRIASITEPSPNELLKESGELSDRGEHERAFEAAKKAVSAARKMNDAAMERNCLKQQAHVVAAPAIEGRNRTIAIDRLRQILRDLKQLGTEYWQYLAAKLWLSRLVSDHADSIVISRQLINRTDVPIHDQGDALSALILALARTKRQADLLATAADLENLVRQTNIRNQLALRVNWLIAVADVGLFEQSAGEKLLACLSAAITADELTIARGIDIGLMTGEVALRAARRSKSREWFGTAREILEAGYNLITPASNSLKATQFSTWLAEVAIDLENDTDAEMWLDRSAEAVSRCDEFSSPEARLSHRCGFAFTKARILMRISERTNGQRKIESQQKSLAAFDEAETLLEKSSGAIGGEVALLSVEIAHGKAIILDRLGDYRRALIEAKKATDRDETKRDPDWAAFLRLHEAELTAHVGEVGKSQAIVNELLGRADLSDQRRSQIQGLNRYLSERLIPTLEWLDSDDAQRVMQQSRRESLHTAIAAISRPLVEWWNAWRTDNGPQGGEVLMDFWGRGAFMRIVAAVRARPTHAIAVDATTIDEVRHWARVFCPLFDTVIVKWKGQLNSIDGVVVAPRHISQGSPGDFGGHGYFSTADFLRDEWNLAVSFGGSLLPTQVCNFLATEAIRLIEQGRLVVLPAPLVGASQSAVGWTDDLLTGGLFRGVVNAANTTHASGQDIPKSLRAIDITTTAIPYMRGVALPTLADMFGELGEEVAELRRLWTDDIAYVANDDWQRINSLERDFDDACRALRERMKKLTSGDGQVGISELAAGTSALPAQAVTGKASTVTSLLHDLTSDRQTKPWIPFWRLTEQGHLLDWNATPNRFGNPINSADPASHSSMGFIDVAEATNSWLCPGNAGCGLATSQRGS